MRGLAAALATSAIVAIAAQGQGVIPDHFAFEDGRLIWIEASPSASSDPCDIRYGHTFDDSNDDGAIQSVDTLREVLKTRTVISGTVTATALGLRREMPYTVLQIDTDTGDRAYLLFAAGRARSGEKVVCTDDATVPGIPTTGDPIVFLTSGAFDATRSLHLSFWVVYEHAGAVITASDIDLGVGHAPKSVREFAQRLREWRSGKSEAMLRVPRAVGASSCTRTSGLVWRHGRSSHLRPTV